MNFASLFQHSGESNMLARPLLREAEENDGPVAAIYRAGVEKLLEF